MARLLVMRICFLPNDFDAPGCYRALFPARTLKARGHDVVLPPYVEKEIEVFDRATGQTKKVPRTEFTIKTNPPHPHADVWVLQQRKERHWIEGDINFLRRWGVASVADVDDNYLELPDYNPAFVGTHPYRRDDGVILNRSMRRHVKKEVGVKVLPNQVNREHMHRGLQMVDAVTVSTPYLAEIYSHLNPRIEVIRNLVDWDIWADVIPQYEVERRRPRIGYLAAFAYRAADIAVIADVIPEFLRRHPEVDFVANSKEMHDALRVPEDQRIIEPAYHFKPIEGGAYPVGVKTAVIDIGLVPLALNGLNQAKSHLKGMEYNAAGIPFIASPTESYKDYWCDEGENGFIAHTEEDWLDHLEYLLDKDEERRKMGKLGRLKAMEHSFQTKGHWWEDYFKSIVGDQYTQLARQALTVGAVQKVTELEKMLRIAASIKPKTFVEIGSARGGTYWAFARALEEADLLVSIDIPSGSPLDVRNGEDVYKGRPERERIAAFACEGQKSVMIDGNSQMEETREELEGHLEGREIDVLFIDGDHRYDGVKRDFELYEPLVRSGGMIFFHDMIPQNDKRSGVHLLWEELKRAYSETYEFVGSDNWGIGQWGGIGVIVKP